MAKPRASSQRLADLAMSRRAALRRRAMADYAAPPTEGPHPVSQDIMVDLLTAGGMGGLQAPTRMGELIARGVDRRVAQRALAAASERRIAEMAAPRAGRVFGARAGGLLTDTLGTPLGEQAAFEEADAARQALHDALMEALKKQ